MAAISATSASMLRAVELPVVVEIWIAEHRVESCSATLCLTGRVIAHADYDHAVGGNTIGPM